MKNSGHSPSIALLLLLSASIGAHASTITNYGDFEASTVWYNQVCEDTGIGTYGTPEAAGDSLTFKPLGLEAYSEGGGSTTNNAKIQFDLQAKEGSAISGVDFSEIGDYSMIGAAGPTYVDVTANFSVTIYEVDGVALASAFTTASTMTFSPEASGTFLLGAGPLTQGGWDGSIYLDALSMLDNEGISYNPNGGGVTKMNVKVDNILVAYSEIGTSALIKKKNATGFTVTSEVIPEPASLVLIAGTGLFCAFIRRRFTV